MCKFVHVKKFKVVSLYWNFKMIAEALLPHPSESDFNVIITAYVKLGKSDKLPRLWCYWEV